MALRDYYETRLQIATANWLRGKIRQGNKVIEVQVPFPGLLYTHPANEHVFGKDAYFAGLKGQENGTPDWLFWFNMGNGMKSAAIELKKRGNGSSPDQITWKEKFVEMGGIYAIAYKGSEFRDIMKSWGLICMNDNFIEPPPSHQEKLDFQMEMYRND